MGSYTDLSPEERTELDRRAIDRVNRGNTFAPSNGVYITSAAAGHAEGTLKVTAGSLNPQGIVHGGCLATLADTVAGTSVFAAGHMCVTLNYSLSFLRPATGSVIRCTASAQKMGRTVSVVAVTLTDDQDREVAAGNFTFFHTGEV